LLPPRFLVTIGSAPVLGSGAREHGVRQVDARNLAAQVAKEPCDLARAAAEIDNLRPLVNAGMAPDQGGVGLHLPLGTDAVTGRVVERGRLPGVSEVRVVKMTDPAAAALAFGAPFVWFCLCRHCVPRA
jgi:hypothetical protein